MVMVMMVVVKYYDGSAMRFKKTSIALNIKTFRGENSLAAFKR